MMHLAAKTARRNLCGEGGDRISPGRGRENNFMREQRTPFAGGGVVVRCAADEFVPAVGFFDEAGGAKGGNELTACVMEKAETRNLKPD